MARNQKLTHVVAGRTVTSSVVDQKYLKVRLSDGSEMDISLAEGFSISLPLKCVSSISQTDINLELVFEDGSTSIVLFPADRATVTVRSSRGALEYVG